MKISNRLTNPRHIVVNALKCLLFAALGIASLIWGFNSLLGPLHAIASDIGLVEASNVAGPAFGFALLALGLLLSAVHECRGPGRPIPGPLRTLVGTCLIGSLAVAFGSQPLIEKHLDAKASRMGFIRCGPPSSDGLLLRTTTYVSTERRDQCPRA
jgi:hypothetical protein